MKTVLIIEDTPDNMKLISFIMEKRGYRVVKAETGQQGLDLLTTETIDFVLLDIQLPDMHGSDVLQQIRQQHSANLPVIAITSHAMLGDEEKLLTSGCNGYIEKPIDPMGVVHQIEDILISGDV